LLLALTGCRGGGHVDFVALNYKAIDPPAPRITRVDMQECYWWTDADGGLWIAMQRADVPPLQPKLAFRFQLSLALEKLPAGRARNYSIGERELRSCARLGPWESRFTARRGIAALYRESDDSLRGNLRVEATRVTARWLGGWGRPTRYLMLGSFVAVRDEQRGRAITEATESAGWEREPLERRRTGRGSSTRPTSQPATSPTAPSKP
jgi:hypothetical protein